MQWLLCYSLLLPRVVSSSQGPTVFSLAHIMHQPLSNTLRLSFPITSHLFAPHCQHYNTMKLMCTLILSHGLAAMG